MKFRYSNLRLRLVLITHRTGVSPGPAEGITYDIRSIDGDKELLEAQGVKPVRRFDPTDEIKAAEVGECGWVQTQPGVAPLFYLLAPEEPTATTCEPGGGA